MTRSIDFLMFSLFNPTSVAHLSVFLYLSVSGTFANLAVFCVWFYFFFLSESFYFIFLRGGVAVLMLLGFAYPLDERSWIFSLGSYYFPFFPKVLFCT